MKDRLFNGEISEISVNGIEYCCCSRYKESIEHYSWDDVWWKDEVKFCPFCGKEIKW